MSASILWLPVDPRKPHHINAGAPSAFMSAMERAGFKLPCTVTRNDLDKIEGMAALFGHEPENNPYQQIIEAIREHGAIEIWAQF